VHPHHWSAGSSHFCLSDQWYEQPYYLAPHDNEDDWFALVQALERKNVIGIACRVMRKKRLTIIGRGEGVLRPLSRATLDTVVRVDSILNKGERREGSAAR
jgi:non-homologous end joining protein Ku